MDPLPVATSLSGRGAERGPCEVIGGARREPPEHRRAADMVRELFRGARNRSWCSRVTTANSFHSASIPSGPPPCGWIGGSNRTRPAIPSPGCSRCSATTAGSGRRRTRASRRRTDPRRGGPVRYRRRRSERYGFRCRPTRSARGFRGRGGRGRNGCRGATGRGGGDPSPAGCRGSDEARAFGIAAPTEDEGALQRPLRPQRWRAARASPGEARRRKARRWEAQSWRAAQSMRGNSRGPE